MIKNDRYLYKIKEGYVYQGQKEIALNMQKEGIDIELITKITGFTLEELKELL